MALTAKKHCELCGSEYATKRPDRAKYCSFCAAANSILYYGETKAKCLACEEAFCVADRRDVLCAKCDHNPKFCRAVVRGNCIACHTPNVTLADADIPVCFTCWKAPAKRPWLLKQLANKRAARIAANKQGDA